MIASLAVTSEVSGLLSINGKPCGEVGGGGRIELPISGSQSLIVRHDPFVKGYVSTTRRIPLSGGRVAPGSVTADAGLYIIEWPGRVIELEITPESTAPVPLSPFPPRVEGAAVVVEDGMLWIYQNRVPVLRHKLPAGALPPGNGPLWWGNWQMIQGALAGGGVYGVAVAFPPGRAARVEMEIAGAQIFLENEFVRALVPLHDVCGHARLETWARRGEGAQCIAHELLWAEGRPTWPQTHEDTARAMFQALRLGLLTEARGFTTETAFAQMMEGYEGEVFYDDCVPLSYAPPGAPPGVGLMRVHGNCHGQVELVRYEAVRESGAQGMWKIVPENARIFRKG